MVIVYLSKLLFIGFSIADVLFKFWSVSLIFSQIHSKHFNISNSFFVQTQCFIQMIKHQIYECIISYVRKSKVSYFTFFSLYIFCFCILNDYRKMFIYEVKTFWMTKESKFGLLCKFQYPKFNSMYLESFMISKYILFKLTKICLNISFKID